MLDNLGSASVEVNIVLGKIQNVKVYTPSNASRR